MQKAPSHIKGFSLVEAILSLSLLALMIGGVIGAILYGEESTAFAGAHARAVFLAEEGLEAVRNIRDENFNNLVDGTFGLSHSANQWAFTTTADTTDIFTRQMTVTTVDANTKNVTSTVTWQQNAQRTGSVSLSTRLTNWRSLFNQALYLQVDLSKAKIGGNGKSQITGLTISNSGAFNITISKMKLTWTTPNQNIQNITIGGTVVWSKDGPGSPTQTQSSGSLLDIVDVTLSPSTQKTTINNIDFTGNMTGSTFTITFTMSDGTQKTVTFTPS